MYEDSPEYAKGRLEGTIVRVGEEPVTVKGVGVVGKRLVARVVYLKDDEEKVVDIKNLNLEPVPLGFINTNADSFYMVRKPMRRDWKQGLRQGNFTFIGAEGFYEIPGPNLRDTVLNIYPKPEEAINLVKNKRVKKVAFSRDFAVAQGGYLLYKGKRQVGTFDKIFTLNPKYNYLNEYLQETLHG